MTPHKHAVAIKAWADGAEIEVRRDPEDQWRVTSLPAWNPDCEYRIKPQPKTICIRLAQFGHSDLPRVYHNAGSGAVEKAPGFIRWLTPPIPITYEEPSE